MPGVLDHYGATNQAEFFAVATEARRFTDVLSTGPCWFRLISSCYAGHAYAA